MNEDYDNYDFDELEGRAALELEEDAEGGFNWGLGIGLVIAAIVLGFVVMDGLESETYFYEADEAVAQGADLIGQTVRVKGIVEPGSVVGEDGHLGREFRVAEKGVSLKVSYDKAMPDTFDENMEVVVHGKVNDAGTLIADEVLVKCPSRYEGAPPTATEKTPEQASL